MALWKDSAGKEPGAKDPFSLGNSAPRESEKVFTATTNLTSAPVKAAGPSGMKESFISSDLVIEGKIEGSGHVRIAGRFKGDVHVQGNVTIEQGAQVTGEVRADMVIVGGEVTGNISAASRVELQSTGVLNGDLNAGSLVVAAGSRMRGQVEFGWNDKN
ncbi:MAG TPA: polymer-forming cytoskeletal protein [Steroidobacteraceae bacterium]|jgi:cytoskeletal protein CcmA (bactofilin family)|nr:polymer-forming cytoskeletal protein [Steroidobacteraceae bacterium]